MQIRISTLNPVALIITSQWITQFTTGRGQPNAKAARRKYQKAKSLLYLSDTKLLNMAITRKFLGAPYVLCEKCSDIWFSLNEMGYCSEPEDNQLENAGVAAAIEKANREAAFHVF